MALMYSFCREFYYLQNEYLFFENKIIFIENTHNKRSKMCPKLISYYGLANKCIYFLFSKWTIFLD